jgi:hypothetical protein
LALRRCRRPDDRPACAADQRTRNRSATAACKASDNRTRRCADAAADEGAIALCSACAPREQKGGGAKDENFPHVHTPVHYDRRGAKLAGQHGLEKSKPSSRTE